MLLEGKTAIITGAASPRGIGKATAQLFAEHGAQVAIVDLAAADAQTAAAPDIGREHRGYACDVRDKAGCAATVRQIIGDFGQVDVLVNNAAISRANPIMEIAPEDYDEVMDVNLRGTLYMSQALIPHCASAGPARSCAWPRSRRSAAAACSAGRTTPRRRAGCWPWPSRWRGNSRRRHSGQRDRAQHDRHRHLPGPTERGAARAGPPEHSRWAGSAGRATSPACACSSPRTCRPTSPAR